MLYEGVAWTTLSVLDWTTQRFTEAGITAARLEAQILLAHVLGCTRMQLYTGFDKPLAEAELASYRGLIKRRLGGEPVSYLAAKFYGLMREKNILVSVFTAPAVPRDTSLARFSIHSDTTPADMLRVADA